MDRLRGLVSLDGDVFFAEEGLGTMFVIVKTCKNRLKWVVYPLGRSTLNMFPLHFQDPAG